MPGGGGARAAGSEPDRRSALARWRARFTGRGDSEHEQVLIRLFIAVAALGYLFVASTFAGDGAALAARCLPLAVAYVTCSAALVAHLLWRPAPRPSRRYAGMVLDMATLTVALVVGERTAAIFYPFYLWITLGMGFRYGQRYLYVSALLSLASFALVVATTPYWRHQPALSAALWCALLVLPAYASSLLAKLTDALARAEAASRTKSRFLATMSHELRTPLNAIIGMADLLATSRLDDEQRDMVRTVRGAGRTLLDMIDDVLDVAKVESGKTEVTSVAFDLHRLLASVRALLHHQAVAEGLSLHVIVDPSLPPRLVGPARFLQQILINLVANGIKFTERGGVTVRCRALGAPAGQTRLRVEVRDTGIGIAAEAHERIFDQFAQADDSTTRRYGGTGLGLAIARQLAGLMGGTLDVESAPLAGATFTLTVPFECPQEQPSRLRGRVVVLAEPAAADALCARVLPMGAECHVAHDVAEARWMLAAAGRERALLVRTDGPGAGALAERLGNEPVSLVVIGDGAEDAVAGCVAALPPEVADDRLFNALHAALAVPEVSELEEPEALPSVPAGRRVLVAEDNRVNQRVIAKILERGGHHVTVVADGEAALDALERDTFEVALMDLNMPVMGGIDAVKMYRFMTGGTGGVRFVALTADATEEARRACAEAGIEEYVTKPVEASRLLSLVGRADRALPAGEVAAPPPARVVPHPRLTSSRPAIDVDHLERLRQLDADEGFLASLVDDFLEDAETLVAELKAAASAGDAAAFRDSAHALRSSAAHLGATALFELCLSWRGIGPAELGETARVHIARLDAEFERLRAALSRFAEGTSSEDRPAARRPG